MSPVSVVTPFHFQEGQLYCESVALVDIAASHGTPTYVYSRAELVRRARDYLSAVGRVPAEAHALICYAVKANGNPSLMGLLAQAGFGADVTSGGELFLALQAGFAADKIIYSGVGKTEGELETAIREGVRALHVESEMELAAIAAIATRLQRTARIGVRVNPNIRADTHPYIGTGQHEHKFGVPLALARHMFRQASAHPWLQPLGLAAHIGSQIDAIRPFVEAASYLVTAADQIKREDGIRLAYIDVGGGLAIRYEEERVPAIGDWVGAITQPALDGGYDVVVEPGRSLVGPAGLLLTQILYTKEQGSRRFVIVDAGMNDLLRPTLYNGYHPITPVREALSESIWQPVEIVGPICETGDWLARARPLPPVEPGDLLAILQTGAYGFAMSSNYNGRLRPAEVLVNDGDCRLIRRRQKHEDLLEGCV